MKWFVGILLVLFCALQYRLWIGEGSFAHVARLKAEIEEQSAENDRLKERNQILAIEVDALKSGTDSIEERARGDMGMIRKGETFYMVVEDEE